MHVFAELRQAGIVDSGKGLDHRSCGFTGMGPFRLKTGLIDVAR
jgi:hypothetical protein